MNVKFMSCYYNICGGDLKWEFFSRATLTDSSGNVGIIDGSLHDNKGKLSGRNW